MSVQVECPHCNSPCLVAEEHVGKAVRCARCKQVFTAELPAVAEELVEFDAFDVADGPAPQPRTASFRLDVGAATSTGRVRERNEDSYLVQHLACSDREDRHEMALAVVADGMGGYEAGDVASGMVTRAVGQALAPVFGLAAGGQFGDVSPASLAETIDLALQDANRTVLEKARAEPGCKGMGATAAAALIWDGLALIGHVGDCRVYHLRGGELTQITRDQTLVERMIELGKITRQEASTHPARNEVTQAVGTQPELQPARYQVELARGDWLVVACDGLHAHLDPEELRAALDRDAPSAAALAEALVDEVNRRGGTDNCTVVVIHCF